jgi:hypothetical protein
MNLFEAVQANDPRALGEALKVAIDVNEAFEGGRTALVEAAALGHADLVKQLLAAGADPSLKDGEHETALLKAAANAHHAVVHLLSPLATEDERDLARAFLKAHGHSHAPEYQPPEQFAGIKRAAAVASARVSKFVGHQDPVERLERVDRAEKNAGRKK